MSKDLEFFQDLAKIKLPKLQIQSPNENGIRIQEENKDQEDSNNNTSKCRTPTSEENKIPPVLSCPAAPRKPRKTAVSSCKRKLSEELQFFEIVNRDEVDSFFKAGFHGFISKKRCPPSFT